MPAKTALSLVLEPAGPAPESAQHVPLPAPAADPVERYGVHRDYFKENVQMLLYHVQRGAVEVAKREGGDKPHPADYFADYTLDEMHKVMTALAEALAAALKRNGGRIRQ